MSQEYNRDLSRLYTVIIPPGMRVNTRWHQRHILKCFKWFHFVYLALLLLLLFLFACLFCFVCSGDVLELSTHLIPFSGGREREKCLDCLDATNKNNVSPVI